MTAIDEYSDIIPEVRVVSQLRTRFHYDHLPCFDYIYHTVDFSPEDYPSGIFISPKKGNYIVDCLFQTSGIAQQKLGSHGDVVIPMFIIEDRRGRAIDVEDFKHTNVFSTYIEKYSNICAAYKVKHTGFFQVEEDLGTLTQVSNDITHSWHSRERCSYNHAKKTMECVLHKGLSSYTLRFLTPNDIQELYDSSELYSYVERYVYCYVTGSNEYLFDNDIPTYIDDSNCIIEPILLENDITNNIPLLKYHAIFAPDRLSHLSVMCDIINNEHTIANKLTSFYSSESDEPLNMLFKDIKNLLIRGSVSYQIIVKPVGIEDDINCDIAVMLNTLRDNREFVKLNLHHSHMFPIQTSHYIKGYGTQVTQLVNTYGVSRKLLNILKLRSDDDVDRIKSIVVNKNSFDLEHEGTFCEQERSMRETINQLYYPESTNN